MPQKPLHIVSFDVPFPADYGGVIDVFNRIKALHNSGFNLEIHCFDYGRGRSKELEKFGKVNYYERLSRVVSATKKSPMIVASRANQKLLRNLCQDDAPILFEGQHCTAFLDHPKLKNRKKLVRVHNIEHEYYNALAKQELNAVKRSYYKKASKKLKLHESILSHAHRLLCITEKDTEYYNDLFGNATHLPVTIPIEEPDFLPITKKYTLCHGNLSVTENTKAISWILKNIAKGLDHDLVISGKNPSKEIIDEAKTLPNVTVVPSPSKERMDQLLLQATNHLLITYQATGIKLKLINALLTKGNVVVNDKMVEGSGVEQLCIVETTPEGFINYLNLANPIEAEVFEKRYQEMQRLFSPEKHVELIVHGLK